MPRRPRIKLAALPQHIVQRGINREPGFFSEEKSKGQHRIFFLS
jgi:putative transposase